MIAKTNLERCLRFIIPVLVAVLMSLGVEFTAEAVPLLSLNNLPAGFVAALPEEVGSCQMAGEVSAFVLKRDAEISELVCVSSFSLAAATENFAQRESVRQIYDQILKNPQLLVEQAKALGVDDIKILDQLQDIGEVATGFSKVEAGIGQTEVALFRRGDYFNAALIRYKAGHEPIVPLKTVARKLDQQVSAASSAAPMPPA
jgi:hypothetical protein